MKNVFIIGSKGIPAKYGGFETFVEKLTAKKKSDQIKYHVSCLADNNGEFEYNETRCFNIKVPDIGAAKAIYYDIKALKRVITYIKKNKIENAVIYILACRIGPFISRYKQILHKLGAVVLVNPDGHEWKRAKWNLFVKKYWKVSEELMVKHSDLLICDSKNIEKYIKEDYKKYNPNTKYIAYGADVDLDDDICNENKLSEWFSEKEIEKNQYFLIVGRFVPENNYEVIIKEFMKSHSNKSLVIITNVEKNNFYDELRVKTKFNNDVRVKFVGTVYDQDLLKEIRRNSFAYIHGHEVGGTNPSLLEALATTRVNLLLDVGFNKEVAEDGAIYFTKESDNLARLVDRAICLEEDKIIQIENKAKNRIREMYTWDIIIDSYENVFLNYNI